MRALRSTATLFVLGTMTACMDLERIEAGACGNGIVEPGEDCDTHDRLGMRCGTPNSAQSCRFACDAGGGAGCRDGWICGEDAICRAPGGGFAALGAPFTADARKLTIVDFDADGQKDVMDIGLDGIGIHYLGADLGEQERLTIPTSDPAPAIGELTGDGLADIALATTAGAAVLRGQQGRAFSPTAYGSLIIPVPELRMLAADVRTDKPGDEPLAIIPGINPMITKSWLILPEEMGDPKLLHILDYAFEDIAEHIGVGHLLNDPTSPCEDLAYGKEGDTVVSVFSLCRDHNGTIVPNFELDPDTGPFVPPTDVPLPPGATLEEGVLVFDMDHDGDEDLVIGARMGNASDTYVAENQGGGVFAVALDSSFNEFPLAIGHLDDDFVPDHVEPCGIHVSSLTFMVGPGCAAASGANDDRRWTGAVIADVNANGIADVAAVSRGRTGVAFYNGAGHGLLNPFEIPTSGTPDHLVAGDFDGDVVTDLAISEEGGESAGDSLSVLFGAPSASPAPPLSMGRLGDISDLLPANLAIVGQPLDGMTDLGVLSKQDGMLSLALLHGSTDRQLYSPFPFLRRVVPLQNVFGFYDILDTPVVTLIGEIVEGPGTPHPDIAALTLDGVGPNAGASTTGASPSTYRLAAVKATGEAELSVIPIRSEPIDDGLPEHALAAAADLDGDGIDEIVLLFPALDGKGRLAIAPFKGGRWLTPKVHTVDLEFATTLSSYPLGPSRATLEILDIDGDGDLDIAALGFVPDAETPHDWFRIAVFWNDGLFWSDDDAAVTLRWSEVLAPENDKAPFLGFAFLQADDDPSKELVALTRNAFYVADLDAGASPPAFAWRPGPGAELSSARAIAAADMNGDGFDDLVIAGSWGVQTFAGLPVQP